MSEKTSEQARNVTLGCQFCLTLNRVDVGRADDRPKCGECGRPMLLDRPVKVTDDSFPHVIKDAEVPVVVDFHADWCGPCKIMAPILDDIAAERKGELLIAKLDTDLNPRTPQQFGIRGIPTLIVFVNGEEAERRTGAMPRAELDKLLATVA